ncbi:MAG: DnaB-like helicase C-terminal domain-containing protein [Candidatus Vidania fulgoroideorum]
MLINNFYSKISERVVLSYLIINANFLFKYNIKSYYFYSKTNLLIYYLIYKFVKKDNKNVDLLVMFNNFKSSNSGIKNKIDLFYINNMLKYCLFYSFNKHLKILKEKSNLRKIYNYFRTKLSQLITNSKISSIEFLSKTSTEIDNLYSKKSTNLSINNIDSIFNNIVKPHKFINTGFNCLDKIIVGFKKGDIIVVAARPSIGKTSFCINLCENISINSNIPVLFCSLEMSLSQILCRLLSSISKVNSYKISNNSFSNYEYSRLKKALKKIKKSNLYLNDNSCINIYELKVLIKKIRKTTKIKLVIIDYLQLMCFKGVNRNNEISEVLRSLKQLAKEYGISIIIVSQLNRNIELRQSKKPLMSDLKDSGSIEQDADIILFLVKNKRLTKNSFIVDLLISKNRNGPKGKVRLKFLSKYTKFIDV